nr:glycosyltransferase family 2 protein [Luteimonas sp. MC1828]
MPCYRVKAHILDVLATIPPIVEIIIVVDDACPERSGAIVEAECTDPRVRVHYNAVNQGVGGAVLNGYREAIAAGADVIVKIDGDGQMDPRLIAHFVAPIAAGEADYTKGNRFFDLTNITRMPPLRIFGNAVLSFMAKLSTGYWDLFDPTNGYTAIHADVARRLPFDRISKRYFFETDLLFRLNTLRAVAVDVPMDAHYGDEVSNLRISRILGEFLAKHVRNFGKRIFYNYFLRDLSLASLELVAGIVLVTGGAVFGAHAWLQSMQSGVSTPAGTVMLSALPIILGLQFVLAFLGYDIASVPRRPLHRANRGMAILRGDAARLPDQGA